MHGSLKNKGQLVLRVSVLKTFRMKNRGQCSPYEATEHVAMMLME